MIAMQAASSFRIAAPESTAVIVQARREGRALALELGFPPPRILLVTTVIAELARNIVMYARTGEISLVPCRANQRYGLSITASDEGPGIANLERAMLCGYSTSGSPGCGLPGVCRIADEFKIDSRPGAGTTVGVILWRDRRRQHAEAPA